MQVSARRAHHQTDMEESASHLAKLDPTRFLIEIVNYGFEGQAFLARNLSELGTDVRLFKKRKTLFIFSRRFLKENARLI